MNQWGPSRLVFENFLFVLLVFVFTPAGNGQQSDSASLHGTVRDTQGNPIAGAVLQLKVANSSAAIPAGTDAQGVYRLERLHDGAYQLKAAKSGYADAEIGSVFLSPGEFKTLDLVLEPVRAAQTTTSKPQFFDQPQFTVSGVTDQSNLGGHGSDTVVRTRETLAKETVNLGKSPTSGTTSDNALRATAKQLRELLAEQDQAETHHQLADVDERLGDSLEAVQQYQRAAEMDPSETYLFDWGAELLLHHAAEPAIEVFSRGNRLFPKSTRMLIGLGAAWFTEGNIEQAVRQMCAASDLNAADTAPYLFLGKMLGIQDAPAPEAVERLHRWVTLQPQNAQANYSYAVALSKLLEGPADKSRLAEAQSFLQAALRINPNFADAHLQTGMLYSEQGKYEAALSEYRQAVQIDPRMEQAHYRLAQAYRLQGEAEKAKEELRIYEQLTKESAEKNERERREIRQFVYTLRETAPPNP